MGNDILTLVLVFLPGVLVTMLAESLTSSPKKTPSDFQLVTRSLIFSIPILVWNWGMVSFYFGAPVRISAVVSLVDYPVFLIIYIVSSSVGAIVTAGLWAWLSPKLLFVLNPVRGVLGYGRLIRSGTVWEEHFAKGMERIVEVSFPDGSKVMGYLRQASAPGNQDRELYLDLVEELKPFSDLLKKTEGAYIGVENGLVIRVVDQADYMEYLRVRRQATLGRSASSGVAE